MDAIAEAAGISIEKLIAECDSDEDSPRASQSLPMNPLSGEENDNVESMISSKFHLSLFFCPCLISLMSGACPKAASHGPCCVAC